MFTNDYAALIPDVPIGEKGDARLRAAPVPGTCRLICFSPRHDLTLPELPAAQIRTLIDVWAQEIAGLGPLPLPLS